jgi:prevent-host-death family protein
METIGLRQLKQNPSKAVARVRAGTSLVVTDRGKPVLRMIPEVEHQSTLQQMISTGEVQEPVAAGMPDVLVDLAPGVSSLSDLLIAGRDWARSGQA